MMKYERCLEVDINLIYEAFQIGFSDYVIKIDMTKEMFVERFFGPEGNSLEHSFVALDENKAVGVILGGIKVYEGINTIRCGTLAVHPEYRGKGISNKLFELHKKEGIEKNCKQFFLEVLKGNDRAINFYKKRGYEKVYDLSYYTLDDLSKIENYEIRNINIAEIDLNELEKVVKKSRDIHINWQNDIDYIKKSQGMIYYGAYCEEKIIGAICINIKGKISFLWVDRAFRGQKIGLSLINTVCKELKLSKLTISSPNNSLLGGFLRHIGFKKDNISQYEMYLTL